MNKLRARVAAYQQNRTNTEYVFFTKSTYKIRVVADRS